MKKITCIVLIFTILLCSRVFALESNLVKNAGFEDGTSIPDLWSKAAWFQKAGSSEFKTAQSEVHSGTRCAVIINNIANHARYKQEIPVETDTVYKISGWIKTVDVGAEAIGANLSAQGISEISHDIRGTSKDWEYVEMYGKTGSEQKSFVLTIELGTYNSYNTGKAFFDDINVQEAVNVPNNTKIINLFKLSEGDSNTTTPKVATVAAKREIKSYIWVALAVAILFLLALIFARLSRKSYNFLAKNRVESKDIDRKDGAIMAVLTIVYLVVALYNLGVFKTPQTGWRPFRVGESITIQLDKEYDISRISYYTGYGIGKFDVQYFSQDGAFTHLVTIDKKERDFFKWAYKTVAVKTTQIRLVSYAPGGELKEIGLFESGSKPININVNSIVDRNIDGRDEGIVENLLDEQGRVKIAPSNLTGMYFDEVYYATTAFEHLHFMPSNESTQPPLGKLIMALGIALFGMNPFGWRIMGVLFGAAIVPLMYLFGKKLFFKRFYAFMAAFLMLVDFMHFTQPRVATGDTFAVFFIILMYYFMYNFFTASTSEHKQMKEDLLLSGMFLGIGVACNWIGLYAGLGLMLLYAIGRIYHVKNNKALSIVIEKKSFSRVLYFVLFFVIIPLSIYVISYIPVIATPGSSQGLADVWNYQKLMFSYHGIQKETYVFQSSAWMWPFIVKPQTYYYLSAADIQAGKSATIAAMGNPAVWWYGVLAVVMAILIAIWKKERKMLVVFTAISFQYLPWFFVSRSTFIYNFFSSVPFVIFCIVYVWKFVLEEAGPSARMRFSSEQEGIVAENFMLYSMFIYLGLAVALFVIFYPVLSGMVVDKSYMQQLRWFSDWVF